MSCNTHGCGCWFWFGTGLEPECISRLYTAACASSSSTVYPLMKLRAIEAVAFSASAILPFSTTEGNSAVGSLATRYCNIVTAVPRGKCNDWLNQTVYQITA